MLSINAGESNHGVPKIGTDFLVATVELIPDNGIRVWFTRPPVVGTGKATDIASYSITGPNSPSLKYATATSVSTKAVNLYFANPILAGQYTLSFNSSNIISNDADSIHLAANTQYLFNVINANKPNGDLDTDLNLTRKFLNPAFLKKNQPNWVATIATLEDNRIKLTDTVDKIFNQCFISSANSKYLITRASDNGISHPTVLGLADDLFRDIVLTLLNDKLTLNANLDLLELLYGADATRANLTSIKEEPYCLFDGATLNIFVDKKLSIPVVFSWSDFVNPLLATAEEISFVINRYLKIYKSTAFAVPYTDLETGKIYVKLFSSTKGLHSAISITSGSSQLALQFDTLLFHNIDPSVSPSVAVTIDVKPLNKALVTITKNSAETIEIFKDTLVGDYINIIGSDFNVNNRGSFIVEEVNQDAGTFLITNKTAVHEVVAPHVNSITIYHPVTKQVTDNVNYAYSTNNFYRLYGNRPGFSKASIPVNTEIIIRTNDDAAYLPSCAEGAETAIYRRPDGLMTTTVSYPTNTFIEITDFLAKLPVAADFVTTTGTPATPSSPSGTSDLSMFSRTFADTFFSGAATCTMPLCIADLFNNIVVIGGEHLGSHTGTNSISVGKINTETVDSNLNFQFTYTWTKTLTMANRFTWGACAALIDYPRFWNNILIAGGYPNGTNHLPGTEYAENKTCLYNAETDIFQEITTVDRFIGFGVTPLDWIGLATAPTGAPNAGNVYGIVQHGDIYVKTPSASTFTAIGVSAHDWRGPAVAPNGDVYVCDYGGDIYKQTAGAGAFNALSQTTRYWSGVAALPNGDIYAAVHNGPIYKQTAGVGDFVAISGVTTRYWGDLAAAPNGNVYAIAGTTGTWPPDAPANIYMQTGGTGDFALIAGQPSVVWSGITVAPNGDVYSCTWGDNIYKQTGGTGNFVSINMGTYSWIGVTVTLDGILYAAKGSNDIYRFSPASSPGYVADAALVWMKNPYNRAVIIGGHDNSGDAIKKCSIWDPSYAIDNDVGRWHQGSGTELLVARTLCQAVDLEDGRVLVMGGKQTTLADTTTLHLESPLSSCEIIEPNNTFSVAPILTSPMGYNRYAFGTIRLPDGRVLAAGGVGYPINKIVETAYTPGFVPLNQVHRNWNGMAAAPNGDIYAGVGNSANIADYQGDIYKRTGGQGDFIAMNQGAGHCWQAMATAPNGDVYAADYGMTSGVGGDIYKMAAGTSTFVALGQTHRNWEGIACAPNGDVYACTFWNGDIYKMAAGESTFVAMSAPAVNWHGICCAPNGDVYAGVLWGGDIYYMAAGTSTFVALNQGVGHWWAGMIASHSGDIYACENESVEDGNAYPGDIYKQTGGIGNFEPLNMPPPDIGSRWSGLTVAPNGDLYACVYKGGGTDGDIFEWVFPQSVLMQHNELKACEIYDPILNIWYSIPEMLDPHSFCDCLYDAVKNRVYVCGGAASKAVEYLDLETMTWHYSTAILPRTSFRGRSAITTGDFPIIARPSGSIYDSISDSEIESNGAFLIPLYNETARSNGINGIQKAIGSAEYQCRTTGWTKSDTAGKSYQVTAIAESRDQIGPYIYDPGQIFGFAEKELTTATEIPRGKGCPTITTVEDISNYEKTGLLVVHFGYKDQAGPISYFVSGPNTLELDPAFNFHTEFPAGITLTIATQKAPYMPTNHVQKGAFWLTASNAGLAIARQYIKDISATGLDLIIKVRYPGDRGLGNEGRPVENSYKLSDIIEVFGPDDDALDTFLKEQRNGG